MIQNTPFEQIDRIIAAQKAAFATGRTLPIKFRKEQLERLGAAMKKWDKAIADAL